MSGNSEGFCDAQAFKRDYIFVSFVFPAWKAVDAIPQFFGIGKVFFKVFVKIHLFPNSREHQHFVMIEFVGGSVAWTIKIIFYFNRFPDPLC